MGDKRKVKLYANDSFEEIRDLKKSLLEKGLEVKHIFTASDCPVLTENGHIYSGIGWIRRNYLSEN